MWVGMTTPFGSGRYLSREFEKMSLAGRTWQDSLRNAWTRDNLGRTQWMLSPAGGPPGRLSG